MAIFCLKRMKPNWFHFIFRYFLLSIPNWYSKAKQKIIKRSTSRHNFIISTVAIECNTFDKKIYVDLSTMQIVDGGKVINDSFLGIFYFIIFFFFGFLVSKTFQSIILQITRFENPYFWFSKIKSSLISSPTVFNFSLKFHIQKMVKNEYFHRTSLAHTVNDHQNLSMCVRIGPEPEFCQVLL